MIKKKFKDDIRVRDRVRLRTRRPGGGGGDSRSGGGGGAPPIQMESNVFIKMIDPRNDEVVEERESHNIFVNYGRDWIAHLISLATITPSETYEREDRVRYMAFGIGGQSQLIAPATIAATWPGYAGDWGGVGAPTAPVQSDTDPTVVGLEWPVLVNSAGEYYDDISAPATYPDVGIVRYTSVLGISEVSFGAYGSVPLSEIGLFTQGVDTLPSGVLTPPILYGALPVTKYMVAYNTFDTLSKTPAFVLQVDWELRFS